MTENSLLELTPTELVIPLKVTLGNAVYRVRHILRPPAAEDWFAYDAALAMAIEEVNAAGNSLGAGPGSFGAGLPAEAIPQSGTAEVGYRLDLRSLEAATLLWDRLARAIEGYGYTAGASWRALVPAAHKEAAIRALTLVAPVNNSGSAETSAPSPQAPAWGEFPLQAEQIPVVLEAIVAGRAYPRLVHLFRPPSADDERRYRRLLAETLIVRGSRPDSVGARTLIPARLARLVRFYDDLILSADGYTVSGQPPTSRDLLIQHMDAWHKRTAVQALFGDASEFTPSSPAPEEPPQ